MTQTNTGIQRVTLTQEHINTGIKGQCGACPIAQCLMANGYNSVSVDYDHAYLEYDEDTHQMSLPEPYAMREGAEDFMREFDVDDYVNDGILIINHDDRWINFEPYEYEDVD